MATLLFGSVLFIASSTSSWAFAQSTDDSWAEPLNLSHSGVGKNPSFVIDSTGVGHVVWQDDLDNYVYTRLDGNQWSTPKTTDLDVLFRAGEHADQSLPAIDTGLNPMLIAGPGQYLFAFWISPRGYLFTSRVKNANFEDLYAWDTRRLITLSATSFTTAIDSDGTLHLAYLDTVDDPETPAGIYYTRSKSSGSTWTVPLLLYESTYFRRLGQGEANLSLATAESDEAMHVYLAWDNRPRKQVFLAQSADGGQNWDEPTLVAGPAPNSGSAGPFNIEVGANQNSVVLVWQSGLATNGLLPACSQIYQSSSDMGTTWSSAQPMTEDLLGCGGSNQFVTDGADQPESLLYFLSETKGQVFLAAWNGIQWSVPQAQPILSGFEEPEIYTEVIYGCRRAALFAKRLYVVGCDEGGGGDVWVTSRALGSDAVWFEPPVWSQLSLVASDNLEMETIELVATSDDLIHAFFSQRQDPAIYYTYWDGEFWSRTTPVVELPEGEAAWPKIATGPGNELFLFASNNKGALYFSRAASGDAASESRWSMPTRLGVGHDGEIGSVDVAWDASGTVYMVYSVPLNDERGIYLVQSKDNGTSWSEPLQVFNGAAAGFDIVGSPSLLISEKGSFHIIWKQQSIHGDGVPQPLALYYTRSDDGGRTFSDVELIVEEPVTWQKIVADHKGNLHLLWQPQDIMTAVWHQVSSDGGRSWQFPQGLPKDGKTAAILTDSAGRLHFVNAGLGTLDHWLWDGSRWQSEVSVDWSLVSKLEAPAKMLAAAVNRQGKMVVVLAIPTDTSDTAEMNLFYSTRTLELLTGRTPIKEVPTPTLLSPTLIPTPTLATPEQLFTLTAPVEDPSSGQGQTEDPETTNSLSPFTMALLPVTLLLLGVLGIVIRRATQGKDR